MPGGGIMPGGGPIMPGGGGPVKPQSVIVTHPALTLPTRREARGRTHAWRGRTHHAGRRAGREASEACNGSRPRRWPVCCGCTRGTWREAGRSESLRWHGHAGSHGTHAWTTNTAHGAGKT